jgi:diguanylate cyclase (GGDEF)-like protein
VGVVALFVRQRNAEIRISLERKRLVDSIESLHEGFALYDADDRLVLCNEQFREISPRAASHMDPGAKFSEILEHLHASGNLTMAGPDGDAWLRERLSRHQDPGEPFEIKIKDGRTLRVSERRTRDGGTVGVYADVTDLKLAQARLEHLATHDSLTNLPNRAFFKDRLEQAVARARRHGHRVAVMFLDLDRFKQVNDTLGHSRGDDLLQEVAKVLAHCLREGDTIARLGGDEFAAVLENVGGWAEASASAERALEAVSHAFEVAGVEVHITTSIGIALFPDDGQDLRTLLGNADAACYHAKAGGRNAVQFYTQEMNAQASERLHLERRLRGALPRGEVTLRYRLRRDLHADRTCALEAVLHWEHPELGEVPPEQFLPVAEEAGLVSDFAEWQVVAVCRDTGVWREHSLPALRVAIRLGARQVRMRRLGPALARTMRGAGLTPTDIVLQIPEATLMADPEAGERLLGELQDSGFQVVIDEFGRGLSSLRALRRFPVSAIKLDPSFVGGAAAEDGKAVLSALVAMAHKLDLRVIADGVTSRRELDVLRSLGCDEVQGPAIGAPMTPEAAALVLKHEAYGDPVTPLLRGHGRSSTDPEATA